MAHAKLPQKSRAIKPLPTDDARSPLIVVDCECDAMALELAIPKTARVVHAEALATADDERVQQWADCIPVLIVLPGSPGPEMIDRARLLVKRVERVAESVQAVAWEAWEAGTPFGPPAALDSPGSILAWLLALPPFDLEPRRVESNGRHVGNEEPESAPFSNHRVETEEDARGKERTVKRPLNIHEIEASLRAIVGRWPKRIVESLFCETADHSPLYLNSPQRLFAWINSLAPVDWAKGEKFITQEQFYEHLRMNSERFEAIESIPHWPPIKGIYYMHRSVPRPSGKLDGLVAYFCPASEADRELIKAFVMTPFWGGAPGRRPAFLIVGPDDDPEQGRGVGKSTLVQVIADELLGGAMDVSPTDQIASVKTRLLSAEGDRVRCAMLDNVKTLKLSWADLEGLITSPTISGHALYKGEGRRPNTLLWGITLNGANLSKDMAQRVIVIKLARPHFFADWEERVRDYAKKHRWDIIADIGQILESEAGPLVAKSRWAAWEQGVLSRVDLGEECQEVIGERQGAIDTDHEEQTIVAEHFREMLGLQRHDPSDCCVFIPSSVAAQWVADATRETRSVNRASAYLAGLGIAELRKSKKDGILGWVWRGSQAGPLDPAGWLDKRAERESTTFV